MWELFDRLSAGTAVDVACGTGRHLARLTELGHQVIGVDQCPEMLEVAKQRMPKAELWLGAMGRLPVRSASSDLTVRSRARARSGSGARSRRTGTCHPLRRASADLRCASLRHPSGSPGPVRQRFRRTGSDPGLSALPRPATRVVQGIRSRRRAVPRADDGSCPRIVRTCLPGIGGRPCHRRGLGRLADRRTLAAQT